MANLLTALRALIIVPVAWACGNPELLPAWLFALLLALAIVTDYFDGIVARARNTESPAGQLFDHGTDFLFVTGGLIGLAYAGIIHPALPLLIIIAFSQYVLDSYFLYQQKRLRMSLLGRWNGIFYFGPLLLVAAARLSPAAGLESALNWLASTLGQLLMLSTLASIIDRTLAPLGNTED